MKAFGPHASLKPNPTQPSIASAREGWQGISSSRYLATIVIAPLLLACPTASADTLGRLFFTPEQRLQLDMGYARNASTDGSSSAVLTVNGIVQKDGGARTVWVNGVSQSADQSTERTPSAQTVKIPGKKHPVKLKVGDKILLDQTLPPDTTSQ